MLDTLKYIAKRLLMAVFILFGVSIIIYALSRMMPTDYVDTQYASAVTQGTMTQEDVDRIKEIYGLSMPDAFLGVKIGGTGEFGDKKFTKNTKADTYDRAMKDYNAFIASDTQKANRALVEYYGGQYDMGKYRVFLDKRNVYAADGTTIIDVVPDGYRICEMVQKGIEIKDNDASGDGSEEDSDDNQLVVIVEEAIPHETGTWELNGKDLKFTTSVELNGETREYTYDVVFTYRVANFWDKTGTVLGNYFVWLGNLLKGDLGMSFKYKQPVGQVIAQNMGISFMIAFIATIFQFLIAIPLGIKAATSQYGVVDYTVTVLTMIGISLPTFFLGALLIRLFSHQLGWFPATGIVSGNATIPVFFDMLHHMILPMFVLVILSVGSLMRYTRTNTLEVLNADYIRTARAKGLSERSVIYKHAFRNTMIPLVTLLAGTIPSLFGGAMITETVFGIPGIGKMAYDALVVADVPFIMGYNMFIAIMTVLGTLLSDLLYAVVDPRVKLSK